MPPLLLTSFKVIKVHLTAEGVQGGGAEEGEETSLNVTSVHSSEEVPKFGLPLFHSLVPPSLSQVQSHHASQGK